MIEICVNLTKNHYNSGSKTNQLVV